jgi:dUTP pyrophosphatase
MGGIQSLPHQDALPPLCVRLDAGGCLPERKTAGSAGYDLTALEGGEVNANGVAKVRTGVYAEIPRGLFGAIKGRSGLASRGILAFEGTVDSDYRGEICVILYNTSGKEVFSYTAGQRIAQLVFLPYVVLNVREVPELGLTTRGDNGFGSTDTVEIKMHPITKPANGSGSGDDLEASFPHDN